MAYSVFYPFCEDEFNESTQTFIKLIKTLKKADLVNPIIAVDRLGMISKALKKANLDYAVVSSTINVNSKQFWLVTLLKLMFGAMPQFRFMNDNKIDLVHFSDINSLVLWGNAVKMNRIPYFCSIDKVDSVNRLTRICLIDSKGIVSSLKDFNNNFPKYLKNKVSYFSNDEDELIFWQERYNIINKKFSFTKTTGLLN
ncbi:MAG: hypothetical protein MJ247_04045 [Alphaproteobacteria bacterium]|nr:hypothetical protein [Alphaproteobacteria bacterium]